jgi:hypothetical protein
VCSSDLKNSTSHRKWHKRGSGKNLYSTKVYGGVEIYLHSFLTLALDQGEWSTSHLDGFTFYRKCPQNPCEWRLGGPTAGVGTSEKRNISSLLGIAEHFLMPNL